MLQKPNESPKWLPALIFATAAAILVVDLMIPLGVAGGVPYILVVLLSYKLKNAKALVVAAMVGTMLTILGFFLSPSGGELWKVLFNRFLALFAIWVVTYACWRNKKNEAQVYKLTEAINQSPNPVVITDTLGTIEFANEAFVKHSGYSLDKIIGNNPRILKSGKHPREFYKKMWDTILSGKVWQSDIYNKKKDGTLYWEYQMIFPLKDIAGMITHFFSLRVLDKQWEKARREVDQLTHTLDQLPQVILITNLEGVIYYANPAFKQVTGYDLTDVLGLNPNLLKSGHQTPEFYQKMWEAITSGETWRGEFKNKRKNGEFYWESAVISPVKDDAGNVTHYFAIRDDITQEKSNAQQLRKAEKQLLYSEKMTAIGQLAAGVSHEVLNPLNIISIQIQVLLRNFGDNPTLATAFDGTLKEIDRIEKILKSLQTFSEDNKIEMLPTPVEQILDEFLFLVSDDMKKGGVLIETEVKPNLPSINANQGELVQLLIHLIRNAKSAMPDGGTLSIIVHTDKLNGQPIIKIELKDSGIGIKKDIQDKIFNPFFSTKPEGEGTGMGLSVCHGIIEKHGGRITFESEENKGTTFIIEIPALPG